MNQILITEKLYITPELKRKKKIYKLFFVLSIFLVCSFISMYIYAEYDRFKSAEVSQEILANFEVVEDTTVARNNVLIVVLDDEEQNIMQQEQQMSQQQEEIRTINREIKKTESGYNYSTIATISIPKINVEYAILDGKTGSEEETEELLKISPIKFWGPEPNEVGNFCIVGHNYRNTRFFSKVPTLVNDDIIEITDVLGRKIQYRVYDKYEVEPTDVSCTTQLTNGKKEITLITCTDDNKLRVIVKAVEV